MKLWLLKPIEGTSEWEPWYDKTFGFVVRAESETDARSLAETEAGDESRSEKKTKVWLDETKSSCVELTADGNEEIIIRDFAAA